MPEQYNDNDLLTTDEVAKVLKMKVRTVREYIRDGKIPYIELDREYRIYWRDVKKFLESRYNPGQ